MSSSSNSHSNLFELINISELRVYYNKNLGNYVMKIGENNTEKINDYIQRNILIVKPMLVIVCSQSSRLLEEKQTFQYIFSNNKDFSEKYDLYNNNINSILRSLFRTRQPIGSAKMDLTKIDETTTLITRVYIRKDCDRKHFKLDLSLSDYGILYKITYNNNKYFFINTVIPFIKIAIYNDLGSINKYVKLIFKILNSFSVDININNSDNNIHYLFLCNTKVPIEKNKRFGRLGVTIPKEYYDIFEQMEIFLDFPEYSKLKLYSPNLKSIKFDSNILCCRLSSAYKMHYPLTKEITSKLKLKNSKLNTKNINNNIVKGNNINTGYPIKILNDDFSLNSETIEDVGDYTSLIFNTEKLNMIT